jgi:hypothetical protein
MTLLRLIPIHVNAVLETLLAPVMIVAPFALGFEPPAMIAGVLFGVLLMGTALATSTTLAGRQARETGLRVSAHASLDLGLAFAAAASAVIFGLAHEPVAGLFFGAVAIFQSVLATTTRYATLPA